LKPKEKSEMSNPKSSPVLYQLVQLLALYDEPTLNASTGSVEVDADVFIAFNGSEFLGRRASSGNYVWVNTLDAEFVSRS
jgi:hypothetical protein